MWHQEFKHKRVCYGVTIRNVASRLDVSPSYVSKVENGERALREQHQLRWDFELEKLNPDPPLELLVDYVRIRFPTLDSKHVIEKILRVRQRYMVHEEYAFYGYAGHYRIGDIVVMWSNEPEKGVLLELKGRGSRQFESYLLAQHRTWSDFFVLCMEEEAVFKRIDLAVNDKIGILSIAELVQKCRHDECISVFTKFKSYRSGELTVRNEKQGMGETLYIGSLKSEVYFCIYEKDHEQYEREGIELEDAEVKNRFELRLKNERAEQAIEDYILHGDMEQTVFSIVNRYVRFVDADADKRRQDWDLNIRWAYFIGDGRGQLRLTVKPEPYTVDQTYAWLSKQVAPTLKMLREVDDFNGTKHIETIIKQAKTGEKHQKLLQQLTLPVEKMIV